MGNTITITSMQLSSSPLKTSSKIISLMFKTIKGHVFTIDDIQTSNGKISNFKKNDTNEYTATFKAYNPGTCTVAVLNADKDMVRGELSWTFTTLSNITPSLCGCDIGLTARMGVDLTYSSKTYPININLDKYLQQITTSSFCKPACKVKTVQKKTCRKEPCKGLFCWYDDAYKMVCDIENIVETIKTDLCSDLDDAQKAVCTTLQNLEKSIQLEIKGTFTPFTQSTIEVSGTTTSAGGDISTGAGVAFLINSITVKVKDKNIDITDPFGKYPIIIDCEAVVGVDTSGPEAYADCAICQQFPSPGGFTINEDGLKATFGNMMWSICYAAGSEDGVILNISGHASISYSIDNDVIISTSGSISVGVDIPLG